ncbi:hypothetical protein A2U01_0089866, partial [Trifolium medium]|nr:hypothetical protein [Trifolium medium]
MIVSPAPPAGEGLLKGRKM